MDTGRNHSWAPASVSQADAERAPPILEVHDLTCRFGGVVAVNRCSFSIERGRITGVIGPNGAGKTTIFRMVAGALAPSSGRILFEGEDITGVPTHEMFHRGIVRTFQIPHEFGRLTTLENLMTVPSGQPGENLWRVWASPGRIRNHEAGVREKAERTLEFLNLSGLRDELAMNLSGGQKKLLELGRAMMTEPRLALLDEPGAGVNPTLLASLAEMIRTLNRERNYTFVIIEHDMDLIASLCDRVIVLAEGAVLTEGTMDKVREDPRVIEAYLGGGDEADEAVESKASIGSASE
ncbi:ABC transporter ATP-binding protein [Thioalkalivibrio sp. HK1]|uniref:ABC transporter ATP-binding protein n=1 Tax=Thioalkalivibrio sp. HK1 TaxID=1469245 RepID=UPI0004B6916C|nr:ABC transporter ATP-binding protein [Thioalkalivibrio sp. HK1]